jgi:hypothetical protein
LHFQEPEVRDFFDNRIVISWKIFQPKDLPPLKDIQFMINSEPELIFEPNQSSVIEIPALEDNKVIINWVIAKPQEKTKIRLSLTCSLIEETQKIVFIP